jgi:hypothetical protein
MKGMGILYKGDTGSENEGAAVEGYFRPPFIAIQNVAS